MSDDDLKAQLDRLTKENEALKAQSRAKPGQLTLKVSEKGAVSVYGLGRFPVTLYQEQGTARPPGAGPAAASPIILAVQGILVVA
jgi:hypothetical protein